VPAYGDVHEHNFDSIRNAGTVISEYIQDGIFYAQGMTNSTSGAKEVVSAGLVDRPCTIDVTYADGGLTGVNGHPKEVYESLAHGFYYPSTPDQVKEVVSSNLRAGDAYWEIRDTKDLGKKWPSILAAKPNLIKVYLVDSAHFSAATQADLQLGKGIDPSLVPLIVRRAHAAGLKVAAHIDTAADFHVALMAGVDEMGHLPGYGIVAGDDLVPYHISDIDIALAAHRGVKVQPTAGVYVDATTNVADLEHRQKSQVDNLVRLKAAGVPILIGSDHYGLDSVHEADYLHSLGLWTNLEILRMWVTTTPQAIFPRRKIGELKPGYEATFLVLSANPLGDWNATHMISDRWKQGCHLPAASKAESDAAKDIRTVDVSEGLLRGRAYFPKIIQSSTAVLLIGGSEGHLPGDRDVAPALARLGFLTLGVDYHDGLGGKRTLSNIPIENFVKGVAWLRAHSPVKDVAVIGESRGTEAALLTAIEDHSIAGVAVISPSSVVWGGYGSESANDSSAWMWRGQALPFLHFPDNAPSGEASFNAALNQMKEDSAAEIRVEEIQGPIFLASSEADAVWPSARMAQAIQARLRQKHFRFPVESLSFSDASHRLLGTGPSKAKVLWVHEGKSTVFDFGGTDRGTEVARDDTWESLVVFLHSLERVSKI
jgi:pimeloyl-ACP methyl ester carboxylesterase